MSDAWLEAIARELGANVRTFPTVSAAVLWFAEQRLQRDAHGIPMAGTGGGPRSQAKTDETNATFARIARCTTPRHRADVEDEPLAFASHEAAARAEAEKRVELLVAFYVSSGERFTNRLQDLGYGGRKQCEAYVLYAERVLRRRFKAEGLLGNSREENR